MHGVLLDGSSPRVQQRRLRVPVGARRLAPQAVDRPVARGRDDPAGRARREAVRRPALDRRGERVRDGVLGDVDVAEDADEDRDRAAVLRAEHALDLRRAARVHAGSGSRAGPGTAAPRPAAIVARGPPCAPSRARRRGRGASTIQNPPMCSLLSTYGPSVVSDAPARGPARPWPCSAACSPPAEDPAAGGLDLLVERCSRASPARGTRAAAGRRRAGRCSAGRAPCRFLPRGGGRLHHDRAGASPDSWLALHFLHERRGPESTSPPRLDRILAAAGERAGPTGAASRQAFGRVSGEVRDEVAGPAAAPQGFLDLDTNGPTEGGLEDRLVGRPCTRSGRRWAEARAFGRRGSSSPGSLAVADVDVVAFAPDFEVLLEAQQAIDSALALLGDRPLELVSPEAALPAALHEPDDGVAGERLLGGVEEVADPVADEVPCGREPARRAGPSARRPPQARGPGREARTIPGPAAESGR